MIGYLCGQLLRKDAHTVILDVEGVGYLIHLSTRTLETVIVGDSYALNIHTAVSDNDIRLYGFPDRNEYDLFRLFIGISGIGPKYALALLNIPYPKLCTAIASGDTAALIATPGIGKKAADRIVLELKSKVDISPEQTRTVPFIEEAVLALTNLGYKRHQIRLALVDLPEEITDSESAIRYFLKTKS